MLKKIVIAVAILLMLVASGLYYAWTNLDRYIQEAVETYGTAATQATVHLGNVKLSLTSGEGSLKDFTVGAPKGFSGAKSLSLGEISVSLDVNSVRGSGPIIIRQIVIDSPQVTYEIADDGRNNLQTISANTKSYAATLNGGGGKPANTPQPPQTPEGQGRKLIIEDLLIKDGQVGISQATLSKFTGSKPLSAALPSIHLTNIGKATDGATAGQVAEQVLGAITNAAAQVASSQLTGQLTNSIKSNVNSLVKGNIGGVGNQLKGLLGQ